MAAINCPVCGGRTLVVHGTDRWGDYGPAVLAHTVPGERWLSCAANRLSLEEAEAVGRIRERDPDLMARAHP